MRKYIIYEDELQNLIKSDMILTALQIGGIEENFPLYNFILDKFVENNKINYPKFNGIDPKNISYADMAEAEIEDNLADRVVD